ncbi:MAG: extracellular solute-binding protein [Lachnospiraceae bacterium]|jgi:ABC-type glycerol-3-phosphate transport system substrate-binding protein|nr:extracellular solute-binding protein [Lachnospiraceae bacterium]
MKSKIFFVGISSLGILILLILISLLMPYSKDEKRKTVSFIYENETPTSEDSKQNILLTTKDAKAFGGAEAEETGDWGTVYLLDGRGTLEWNFTVENEGEYFLSAGYMPLEGNGQNPEFDIALDGATVNQNGITAMLTRLWGETGKFGKTASGNEIKPRQTEIFIWTEENFKNNGLHDTTVYLTKGEHTLHITNKKETLMINYVKLYEKQSKSYEEYLSEHEDVGDTDNYFELIEAETPYLKSSSELYPIYDRSSPYTSPYHPTQIRMNTMGGDNWSEEGQWIEWEIEVEQDGYYQIGTRFRQNVNKGMTSSRKITIDGNLLFDNLAEISFPYEIGWQTTYLGDEEPYKFYLKAGKHRIRMEVTLESLYSEFEKMEDTVYQLNELYRQIIVITGTNPDVYRDYNLESAIPNLIESITDLVEQLNGYEEFLIERYGENSPTTRVINQLKRQMESFINKPYTIQKRLSTFKTNISALAEWVFAFREQSLEVDCFYVTGVGADIPKAETNLFGKVGHEIRSFLGTFTQDYNDMATEDSEDKSITVWIGKGRDYGYVLKRLIDEYFTPETGINVSMSLVDNALVKATIAGKGPDINLFTTRVEAMNLAFRGALEPLENYEGFPEIMSEYMESAVIPYEYQGSTYGIPTEQNFYMMFCRTDVLDSLGLQPPETWDELMSMMPILQGENLQIGLPYTDGHSVMNSGVGMANLYPTLLAQNGVPIYNDSLTGTNLDMPEAYEAFKMWTDFYAMYDYPLYKDDFNRFRTGEMPILITNYIYSNYFHEAAPEITGQWTMSIVPGTVKEDGSIDHSTSAGGTASVLSKNAKDKEAAWEFIRWWNSAEVQELFSKEIDAELSILGRFTPANIKAFKNTNWYDSEKETLLKQWQQVVEIPEILGGYYTTRNIDNAFRAVYFNGENARESLYYWNDSINQELKRKQNQLSGAKEAE